MFAWFRKGGLLREIAFTALAAFGEGAGFVLAFLFLAIVCGLLRGC